MNHESFLSAVRGRSLIVFLSVAPASGFADEPARILCDPDEPSNHCPGESCLCAPDGLEIEFRGSGGPTYSYDAYHEGMAIEMSTVVVAESQEIQGFRFGVAHDPEALEALQVDVDEDMPSSYVCELCPANWPLNGVQTCGDDPECAETNRTAGGGFIVAVILSFTQPVSLPVGHEKVFYARYRLLRDVGEPGTRLRFSDRLAKQGQPRILYNVTISDRSRVWGFARDGLIRRAPASVERFRRGDADGDGRLTVADAIWMILAAVDRLGRDLPCEEAGDANDDGAANLADAIHLLRYIFAGGPSLPPPGFECGADPTQDGLRCFEARCP